MTKKRGTWPKAFLDRMQDEAQGADPEALDRFIAKYGMTPMQYALSKNPTAAAEIAQHWPHLLPPKKAPPE